MKNIYWQSLVLFSSLNYMYIYESVVLERFIKLYM